MESLLVGPSLGFIPVGGVDDPNACRRSAGKPFSAGSRGSLQWKQWEAAREATAFGKAAGALRKKSLLQANRKLGVRHQMRNQDSRQKARNYGDIVAPPAEILRSAQKAVEGGPMGEGREIISWAFRLNGGKGGNGQRSPNIARVEPCPRKSLLIGTKEARQWAC